MITKRLDVIFYRSDLGNEPVRNWLKMLLKEDKQILGEDIKTVQYGWPLGMPLVKNLGDGLWEIRSTLKNKRIVRIIFFMHQGSMVLLHSFIKKSQKTLSGDISLARDRKRKIERGH